MTGEIVITYSVHKDGRVIQQSAYEVVINTEPFSRFSSVDVSLDSVLASFTALSLVKSMCIITKTARIITKTRSCKVNS